MGVPSSSPPCWVGVAARIRERMERMLEMGREKKGMEKIKRKLPWVQDPGRCRLFWFAEEKGENGKGFFLFLPILFYILLLCYYYI